jgi:hypothetical protein
MLPIFFMYKDSWKHAIAYEHDELTFTVNFTNRNKRKTVTVPKSSPKISNFGSRQCNTARPMFIEIGPCSPFVCYDQGIMSFEMMSTEDSDVFFWYHGPQMISDKKILQLKLQSTIPDRIDLYCVICNNYGFEVVECHFSKTMFDDSCVM